MSDHDVVVISGAASGIGLELARTLSATHRIALLDRNAEAVARAAAEIGANTFAATCDITDRSSLDAAIAAVIEKFGRIDVAVSNAGIGTAGVARHLDPDALADQLDVNLTGNWRFIHACLPHLERTRGYVLGVTSAAAIMGPPGESFYAASKAGLEALLETVRVEVSHLGIDVGIAYLMFIDTPLVREGDAIHPDLAAIRQAMPGPARKTYPVSLAADTLAQAIRGRKRNAFVPKTLKIQYALRSIVRPLIDRSFRDVTVRVDALTKQKVDKLGSYGAAFGRPSPR